MHANKPANNRKEQNGGNFTSLKFRRRSFGASYRKLKPTTHRGQRGLKESQEGGLERFGRELGRCQRKWRRERWVEVGGKRGKSETWGERLTFKDKGKRFGYKGARPTALL